MAYLFLAAAFIANGIANVLLKMGADRGVESDLSLGLVKLVSHNIFLVLGVGLFAVNILAYIAALRLLPLSVAYPVMVAMSFLIASTGAFFFLHESFGWVQFLGYVLILSGITVVVSYAR